MFHCRLKRYHFQNVKNKNIYHSIAKNSKLHAEDCFKKTNLRLTPLHFWSNLQQVCDSSYKKSLIVLGIKLRKTPFWVHILRQKLSTIDFIENTQLFIKNICIASKWKVFGLYWFSRPSTARKNCVFHLFWGFLLQIPHSTTSQLSCQLDISSSANWKFGEGGVKTILCTHKLS